VFKRADVSACTGAAREAALIRAQRHAVLVDTALTGIAAVDPATGRYDRVGPPLFCRSPSSFWDPKEVTPCATAGHRAAIRDKVFVVAVNAESSGTVVSSGKLKRKLPANTEFAADISNAQIDQDHYRSGYAS
jgi:hypothetical protein